MAYLKCYSLAFMTIVSLQPMDLINATGTYSKYSTMTLCESSLINDSIHHVGELFGGGVVFYVDNSGEHGLICSNINISNPNSAQLFKKQDPTKLKGRPDSVQLINQVFAINSSEQAKEVCDNYSNSDYNTGVFSDWRLPTRDELEILFRVKDKVNKALENFKKPKIDPLDKTYWSSSKTYDEGYGDVWLLDFDGGSLVTSNRPIPGRYFVRAVRAF